MSASSSPPSSAWTVLAYTMSDEEKGAKSLHHTESRSATASSVEKLPIDSTEYIHGNAKQLDVALSLVAADGAANQALESEFSPKELRRLRWKLDRHLLPLLCLIYTGIRLSHAG